MRMSIAVYRRTKRLKKNGVLIYLEEQNKMLTLLIAGLLFLIRPTSRNSTIFMKNTVVLIAVMARKLLAEPGGTRGRTRKRVKVLGGILAIPRFSKIALKNIARMVLATYKTVSVMLTGIQVA